MEKLLIFPYNGNALEALDCLGVHYEFIGFIDDDKTKQGTRPEGTVFSRDALVAYPDAKVLAVPGNPANFLDRRKLIGNLGVPADRWATVVHPRASVSSSAKIGKNVLLMAGAVITANAEIGDHVCILPNSVIHHESKIGDWTLVGSNVTVAGRVRVGKNCYLGAGSTVIQDVKIGDRSLVGMASNVIRPLAAGSRVAGNPAEPL